MNLQNHDQPIHTIMGEKGEKPHMKVDKCRRHPLHKSPLAEARWCEGIMDHLNF